MKRTMWKRGCSLLFTLVLVIGLMPVTALADGITGTIPEGLQLNGTIVTGYTDTDTELEIPEGVTEIGSSAFLNSTVQEVTLPSTLTTIGEYAFTRSALTSITIPASVTTIEAHAFTKTKSLTYAVIEGNPTLGNNAFSESGIKSIKMDQVTTISYQCFYESSLSSISMASVTSIGEGAFQYTNFTEFTVPDTVESIGSLFLDYVDLDKLTVSLATLKKPGIDVNAFANISSGYEVVLTGVDTDITLLEEGFSIDDKTYAFLRFSINTVQDPSNCTITNQTGEDVSVVVGGETITLANGNVKPVGSAANGDAYLENLTVTAGSSALALTPGFSNPVFAYTAQVDNETASVSVTAQPSNSAASVSINGQVAYAGNSYTVDVALAVGENPISIVVTAPDDTTQTYTVTVTRNEAVPQHLTISTAEELMDFASKINNGTYVVDATADMVVELTADIDMIGYDWVPIGNEGIYYFTGVFDGNDHTISGLTLDTQSGLYLGLFGATANTTIQDVHVKGTIHNTISVQNRAIGGIVGLAQYCEITGCTTEFTVTCETGATLGLFVGGIVGEADYCHIENCESNTTLSGKAYGYWGGIAGAVVDTELINCVNRGNSTITEASGYLYMGGIAGTVQSGGMISQCRNLGNLSLPLATQPSLYMVGGICGQLMGGEISDCTNYGAVSAKANSVGGIVGEVTTSSQNKISSTVKSCLNYGEVSSSHTTSNTGGIAASVSDYKENGVELAACVSLGSVTGGSKVHAITGYATNNVTFRNNYYDSTITSTDNISQAVTDGSTGMPLENLETEAFIQQVNAEGGNFRLDADGNIQVIPLSYALTVENSYADVTGAGQHEEGEQVTIDAGTRPGYRFAGWTTTSGTITNPSASRTTFTMPDKDATVTASWEYVPITTYPITVKDAENGTVTCYAHGAAKDAVVTLRVKADVGYQLDKLTVTDANGNTRAVTKVDEKTYTFVMPACAVTVEAVFAPITSGLPFTDVNTGDWFYGAVKFVYENGLMDGVGNNLFAPNATLNRAMAVTILYRLEGSPAVTTDAGFNDVAAGTWYTDAVNWAAANNIVNGVEGNNFDPTGSLTREQMATVLYRYAQYKGADVSASGDLSGFVDSANVSSWAADAVKWAVGSGLVNGVEGNALAPQGTSTRAQAATVLMRFVG